MVVLDTVGSGAENICKAFVYSDFTSYRAK